MLRTYILCLICVILKYFDFPNKLFFHSNYFLDYQFYKPFYTVIPFRLFPFIVIICDILTAYRLKSFKYFYYTIFLPIDITSLENVLIAFSPSFLDFLGPWLDPLLGVLHNTIGLLDIKIDHIPSLSINWSSNMCIISQFHPFTRSYALLISFFLIFHNPKLFPMLKTRATFRNYLYFIHESNFLPLYFSIYILFGLLNRLFNSYFVVNTNFLYWVTLIFNGLYIYELKFSNQ